MVDYQDSVELRMEHLGCTHTIGNECKSFCFRQFVIPVKVKGNGIDLTYETEAKEAKG